MNIMPSQLRSRLLIRTERLGKWLQSNEGRLTMLWLVRFLILWVVTAYFAGKIEKRSDFIFLNNLRLLLLLFWGYVVFMGIVGVYRPRWQSQPRIKSLQVAIEIVLFSLFVFLAQDSNAVIYFIYLLPLTAAAQYLPSRWAIRMTIFLIVSFFVVRLLMPGTFNLNSFLPQALFLILVFGLFSPLIGRRRSVLEDAKNDTSEVMDVLNQYDEGIFVIDGNNFLRYVNEALQEKHGSYQPNRKCSDYFNCSKDDCSWCHSLGSLEHTNRTTTRHQGEFVDHEGTPYQIETMSFPLLSEDRAHEGAIIFVRNVEDRRKLEKNIQQMTSQQVLWRETYDAMGKKVAGFGDVNEMMQFLVNETKTRLGAETSALFLLEDTRLVRKAIAGVDANWFSSETYNIGEGITGKAILPIAGEKYAQPILANDVATNPKVVPRHLIRYSSKLESGIVQHLIAVPLNNEEGSFGVLRVVNKLLSNGKLAKDGFTQQDVDFLVTLASMVALAIDNQRLVDKANQGLKEITTLLDINQSITQTLDLNKLLFIIVSQAKRISHGDKSHIQLIDQQTQTLVTRVTDGPKSLEDDEPMGVDEGIAGRAIRRRDVVYVPDTQVDSDFLTREGIVLSSLLVIPLIAGKRVLGLLNVNSSQKNAFTKDQIRQLKALAAPASIAIEKAQLYEKTKALHRVTDLVNKRLDQGEIYSEVLPALQQVVSFDSVSIQVLEKDCLKVIHAWGFKQNHEVVGLSFPAYDKKFPNHEVLLEKGPIIIDDVRDQYRHFLDEGDSYNSTHIRNWLGVPLIREDRVVGMIAMDKKSANFYTQTDADLALTFANNLAIALENINLYKVEAKQSKMLSPLVDASRGLITHSSLEELFKYCAIKGAEIFNVEDCSLSIIDEESKTLELVSSTCLPPEICAQSTTLLDAEGLRTYVIRSGETLSFGSLDYMQHPAWSGKHLEHLAYLPSKECKSLLLGPLVDSQGQIIGVLRLENKLDIPADTPFSDLEIALHETFSSHVGTAIERVRLFNSLDSEARQKARESLSHDLHDTASFVHGALVLRTAVAQRLVKADARSELLSEIVHLHKAARHTYNSIRLLHQDSRDPILEQGLFFALKRYANMLSIENIEFYKTSVRKIPPHITYGLYKIGQEGISNVARHAGAAVNVEVCLNVNDRFEMKIKDDGIGFYLEKTINDEDSFGLQGMLRWAKTIDGDLVIQSKPGVGTEICISGELKAGDEE